MKELNPHQIFDSFENLNNYYKDGIIIIKANQQVAFALLGNIGSKKTLAITNLLLIIPYFIATFYIIKIIFNADWWYLASLPILFPVGFFLLTPSGKVYGPFRQGLIILSLGGLVYSFMNDSPLLTLLFLVLTSYWLCTKLVYYLSEKRLIRALLKDKALFFDLWNRSEVKVYTKADI